MENEKPKRKREKTKGLPADPASLEAWQNLPQGTPSREALPPATKGGWTFFGRFLFPRGLFLLFALVILLSLIAGVVSKLG